MLNREELVRTVKALKARINQLNHWKCNVPLCLTMVELGNTYYFKYSISCLDCGEIRRGVIDFADTASLKDMVLIFENEVRCMSEPPNNQSVIDVEGDFVKDLFEKSKNLIKN